jgi:SAM-dependent methyltransferase
VTTPSSPPRGARAARSLSASEAAIFETFVVPRYLSLFGDLALEMIAEGEDAQVLHVLCRTGYPDRGISLKMPTAHVYGCDPSAAALELARAKAATKRGMVSEYRVAEGYPTPYPDGAFSHVLSLHPLAAPEERRRLMSELARLLGPSGQALIAMPIRGSFQEITDLLREYSLKYEALEVSKAVEAAALIRPTVEMFGAELEEAGFDYVDVQVRPATLKFQSGRDFFEDPVTRLMLLPEFRINLALEEIEAPFSYVRDAIDKYWSDGAFELTVNVGCVSGRRRKP